MPPLSHLVLTGFAGTTLTAVTKRRLERLAPGGVVLFRRNVGTPRELERLTGDLRNLLGRRTIVAIDQEGGRVARVRAPATVWPPLRVVGCARRRRRARRRSPRRPRAGRGRFRRRLRAGARRRLEPREPGDRRPLLWPRPAAVARLAIAFAPGSQDGGVLPCGKHFPGHGDTALDSHLDAARRSRARAASSSASSWRRSAPPSAPGSRCS